MGETQPNIQLIAKGSNSTLGRQLWIILQKKAVTIAKTFS